MTAESPRSAAAGKNDEPLFWVTPKGARIALIALHAAAIVSVLIELMHSFPEGAHAVERVHALDFPASYAVYGFVACVVLVLIGRVLRRIVMRSEDYYRGGR